MLAVAREPVREHRLLRAGASTSRRPPWTGTPAGRQRSSTTAAISASERPTLPFSQSSMIECTVLPTHAWYPPCRPSPSSADRTYCSSQFSSVESREYETRMVSCSGAPVSVQSRWNHQRARIHAERDQSFERGQSPGGRHVQVRERPPPRGGRLAHRHGLLERTERDRRPRRRPARRRTATWQTDPSRVRLARGRARRGSSRGRAPCGTAGARPPAGPGCARIARSAVRARPGRTSARAGRGSGSCPRRRPATTTVSNSGPTAPWAVEHVHRVRSTRDPCRDSRARARRRRARGRTPRWTGRATRRPPRPRRRARRRRRAPGARRRNARPRPPGASEYGRSCQRIRNASSTDRSATARARASTSRTVSTSDVSGWVRPSVCSSAAATVPSAACAARISPRADAGDSRTRSDVSTDSTSCSRASASAISHRSARTYGNVAGSAVRAMPLSGSARGTPASSSARNNDPTCAPCRRTTTARSFHGTPSSTWSRRSSRAIAACSSEMCGASHASTVTPSSARCGVSRCDHLRAAEPLGEAPDRDVGRSLEREDVRVGVAGDDEVGRRESGQDRLGGERQVLVVVDEQVVEQRLAVRRHLRRALQRAPRSRRRSARRSRPGTRGGTRASSFHPPSPAFSARSRMSSGVSSASCARERNWRTSSANARMRSMCPYAGHCAGSCSLSNSWTSANWSPAGNRSGGSG